MHKPVLLNEVIKLLQPKSGDNFIDGTFGGGGHSKEIWKKIGPTGKLLAIDWNKKAIRVCQQQKNFICVEGNFADLPKIINDVRRRYMADGLLLDLGVSSDELEKSGRGFSFQKDEPLLMTYSDQERPIYQVLVELNERELADIIRHYGEERFASKIARSIKERCRRSEMKTTKDLSDAILAVCSSKQGRLHPATKTFMALRIYANRELDNLQSILDDLEKIMNKGGRVAIISFHSLEDRLVKQKFRELARSGKAELLTKKPITPDEEEIKSNPRSRSAKLRALSF